MKAHRLNKPMLTGSQQIARTTDFKVAHGNRITRAELCVFGNDFQPLLTVLCGSHLIMTEEVGVRPHRSASHPSA